MNSVFFFIWGELLPAAQLNFHLFVSPTCYFYTDLSFFRVFVCNFVFHAASVLSRSLPAAQPASISVNGQRS